MLLPKGGGGLGGGCMEQRHLGVVGWGKTSTAGRANIEDNADSPLANGEGAAGTLGVPQQQSQLLYSTLLPTLACPYCLTRGDWLEGVRQ